MLQVLMQHLKIVISYESISTDNFIVYSKMGWTDGTDLKHRFDKLNIIYLQYA